MERAQISGGEASLSPRGISSAPLTLSGRRRLPAELTLDLSFARRGRFDPDSPPTDPAICRERSHSAFESTYELGDAVGSGTTSVVRLATRREDGQQIAVKCFVSNDDDEMKQFAKDEYDLVRKLRHPSIIKFEALFYCRDSVLICMELCLGGSLEEYVLGSYGRDASKSSAEEGLDSSSPGQTGLCEEEVMLLGSQLLRGINYLHHKRVVHRDVKPSNLLLQRGASFFRTGRQQLKISDFNSAKRIGSADGLMLTDRGTKLYTAPELRFGRLWTERIDIWGVGLCLYFMSTAALPFDNGSQEAAAALSAGYLPEVDWSCISPSLANLIRQCLTVDGFDRPPAMELLVHPCLARFQGLSTSAESSSRQGSKEASTAASPQTMRRICTGTPASRTPTAEEREDTGEVWPDRVQQNRQALRVPLFVLVRSCGLLAVRGRLYRAQGGSFQQTTGGPQPFPSLELQPTRFTRPSTESTAKARDLLARSASPVALKCFGRSQLSTTSHAPSSSRYGEGGPQVPSINLRSADPPSPGEAWAGQRVSGRSVVSPGHSDGPRDKSAASSEADSVEYRRSSSMYLILDQPGDCESSPAGTMRAANASPQAHRKEPSRFDMLLRLAQNRFRQTAAPSNPHSPSLESCQGFTGVSQREIEICAHFESVDSMPPEVEALPTPCQRQQHRRERSKDRSAGPVSQETGCLSGCSGLSTLLGRH